MLYVSEFHTCKSWNIIISTLFPHQLSLYFSNILPPNFYGDFVLFCFDNPLPSLSPFNICLSGYPLEHENPKSGHILINKNSLLASNYTLSIAPQYGKRIRRTSVRILCDFCVGNHRYSHVMAIRRFPSILPNSSCYWRTHLRQPLGKLLANPSKVNKSCPHNSVIPNLGFYKVK